MKQLLLAFLLTIGTLLGAQTTEDPKWYTMMQDPNANYFETIKAYKEYWKGKKMPPNKEQRLTPEYKEFFAKMTPEERNEYERIFMLNKEFKNWRRITEDWVQPDGRILSEAERQAILDAQRADLKAIEKANGQ